MSKEQEESLESLDSLEETTQETSAPETEEPAPEVPANSKFLAIKSALKQKEEEAQQEEMKLHIADKVKKMKTAKESPQETPEETPDAAAEESSTPDVQMEEEAIAEESAPDAAIETEPAAESAATEDEPVQEPAKKKKSKKEKQAKSKKVQNQKKKKKRKTLARRFRELFPERGDGFLEVFRKIVFLSSSVIFVVCLGLIADYFWDNYQNALLTEDLQSMYGNDSRPEPEEPQEETRVNELGEPYEYYPLLDGAERMLEINPDVCGWIQIPGTDLSYPILQKKDDPEGNEYYLERNIYLEEARAGSIFLDFRNEFDYVIDGKMQSENSQNLIIYGHNMQDYSMFGGLKHYVNNIYYYGEHPIVELNSNYKKYQYKIFGMIIVDIDDETETRFDYWNKLDFADERDFYDYVNEIKRRTIRLNDVDVTYGDELLTLSTCNSTFSNGRLVIFARKVREGEDPYEGTQNSTANPNVKWCNSYYQWHKNTYDPDAEFVPYG